MAQKAERALAGRQWAPDPETRSADSPTDTPSIALGNKEYDARGNLTKETGPNGRCRTVLYSDSDSYGLFPVQEAVYVGDCATPGAAKLETYAGYDAGLGLVTSVQDMTGQQSLVNYDSFGRLTALFRPNPDGSALDQETLPSVKISYDLPAAGSGRAYSVIHTHAHDGELITDNEYLESYSYVDGMGRARVGLAEADPSSEEDNAHWIVSTIAEFDGKGAVQRKFLPFYFTGTTPVGFPVADTPPDVQYGRQRYDAFGRQVQTTDVDGTVTLQSRYHALSSDLYDAADIYPGPHQGTYATTRSDGHGRTVATTERIHESGVVEAREVRTTYLPTGEPVTITRVRVDKEATSPPVMRWMRYDSLGRMVVNADPHATVFTGAFPEPSGYTDALRTWRYAYNDAGDLVGTSDARMCGQNFFYDNAGRLTAEDYSPCVDNQALYSPPISGSGYGLEVIYQFDSVPSDYPSGIGLPGGWGIGPGNYSTTSPTLRGRLVAVHDRAATTWFKYDARGRVVETARKVAKYNITVTSPQRYRSRWYYKQVEYDAADRPTRETTGATQLLGANDQSAVTTEYTRRGDIKGVGSSYGALVKRIDRDAEGKVSELTFGDVAETKTHSTFDSRRRLASVQTYRGAPALWSSEPAAYTPAPAPNGEPPTTFQLLLQDLDYKYDIVNNPVEIRDWRSSDEWPAGSKPVSRRMEYDDLYRVTRVDYEYPGGTDKMVPPFAPEMAGQTDSRRPPLVGHKIFPNRPLWQTYRYDWLGNTARTDDDRHAFYDRSLGNIGHTAAGKPYQLTTASQPSTAGPDSGSVSQVTYDAAGNLTSMRVARTATECDSPGKCTLDVLRYQWDEVGRLYRAEHAEAGANLDPVFFYLYDYNDERVVREDATVAQRKQTLYVFDSLEIRGTQLDPASSPDEYILNDQTEVPYLSANGMRLGRVVKEPAAADASFKDEPQLSLATGLPPSLHVFLTLPDHLGSTSLIIDKATSELVEARSYQPYGATESDYRPERWKGFREDYGFTGKEEDVEMELQYFGKRYLSPYLGRWISPDPLAVHVPGQADLNLYAYVSGRVLKNVDPLGLDVYAEQEQGPAQVTQTAGGGGVTTLPTVNVFATDTPTLSEVRGTSRLDGQDLGISFDSNGAMNLERAEAPKAPAASLVPPLGAFEEGVVNALAQTVTEPVLSFFRGQPDYPDAFSPVRPFANGDDVLGGVFVNGLTLGIGLAGGASSAGRLAFKMDPRLARGGYGTWGGRTFDLEAAGGPIRSLGTDGVRVTNRGIDVVEGHLARFGPDAANEGMVLRLREIAGGRMTAEQVDLNFYTHELREFVRYRQLGFRTGAGGDYDLWNNTHSATLADYGLVEGPGVLYHPSVAP